jgi:hypothetical protein
MVGNAVWAKASLRGIDASPAITAKSEAVVG